MYAQEIDSVSFYELEPVYITSQKDDIDFTTLNYFASTNKQKKWIGGHTIGNIHDSSNNYGVRLKTKPNNNRLLIQEASFLIFDSDTVNIMNQTFFVLIENNQSQITKKVLNPKEISFTYYSYFDKESKSRSYLVNIKFDITEINFQKNDALYFLKEDYPIISKHTTVMMTVPTKKDKSYYYEQGKIIPIKDQMIATIFGYKYNGIWQVRLKYCEYYKGD